MGVSRAEGGRGDCIVAVELCVVRGIVYGTVYVVKVEREAGRKKERDSDCNTYAARQRGLGEA